MANIAKLSAQLLGLIAALLGGAAQADSVDNTAFGHPLYLGLSAGVGSTTWAGLVPRNPNPAILIATPSSVHEGGKVWGAFAGYELIPYFAIEGSYLRYPSAKVSFTTRSLFSFSNYGQTSFTTHTEVYALVAKIMMIIPHTMIRVYSSLGPAEVHRSDSLANLWRLSPNFGVGVNYNFSPHIMGELGGSYTGGYGESQLNPSQNYIPFLYSGFLRLAYRF